MAAAAAELLDFADMTEDQLLQWIDASPSRVNDLDEDGITPLYAAVFHLKNLPLVLLLLDEKGADVNTRIVEGQTLLHGACSLDALLDRGGDPTLVDDEHGQVPIMFFAFYGDVDVIARCCKARASETLLTCKTSTAKHHFTLPAAPPSCAFSCKPAPTLSSLILAGRRLWPCFNG